jgi:hypothetical protein
MTGSTEPLTGYNYLSVKYRHLFTNERRNPVAMFGFECGDGWYKILEQLISHIDHYLNHKYKGEQTDFEIVQIKEKFGGLRFYVHNADDVIHELIRFTENLSYRTCEYCGSNQNVMRSKGWIVTACKDCIGTNQYLIDREREWVPIKD